jgi:hypothetical protein
MQKLYNTMWTAPDSRRDHLLRWQCTSLRTLTSDHFRTEQSGRCPMPHWLSDLIHPNDSNETWDTILQVNESTIRCTE